MTTIEQPRSIEIATHVDDNGHRTHSLIGDWPNVTRITLELLMNSNDMITMVGQRIRLAIGDQSAVYEIGRWDGFMQEFTLLRDSFVTSVPGTGTNDG